MGILDNIANTAQAGTDQEERVSSGGSGFSESGIHMGVIKMAKVMEASSGAVGIAIEIETEDKKTARITEWIQSGDAKGNKTTYTDKDGNEVNLPGMTKIKNLNFLLTGVFGLPSSEEKEIKEYDWDLKQEVSVRKDVVVPWLNRPIGFCIMMTMEDKYQDEANFTTKQIVEHFFDPVTDQFGSEKINSKPAEMRQKFLDFIEKTPIKDKRKKSKGATTEGGATTNTPAAGNAGSTTNAGFG